MEEQIPEFCKREISIGYGKKTQYDKFLISLVDGENIHNIFIGRITTTAERQPINDEKSISAFGEKIGMMIKNKKILANLKCASFAIPEKFLFKLDVLKKEFRKYVNLCIFGLIQEGQFLNTVHLLDYWSIEKCTANRTVKSASQSLSVEIQSLSDTQYRLIFAKIALANSEKPGKKTKETPAKQIDEWKSEPSDFTFDVKVEVSKEKKKPKPKPKEKEKMDEETIEKTDKEDKEEIIEKTKEKINKGKPKEEIKEEKREEMEKKREEMEKKREEMEEKKEEVKKKGKVGRPKKIQKQKSSTESNQKEQESLNTRFPKNPPVDIKLNDGDKDDDECHICKENRINCVMIPCGHYFCCYGCSLKSPMEDGFLICQICREPVESVNTVFKK